MEDAIDSHPSQSIKRDFFGGMKNHQLGNAWRQGRSNAPRRGRIASLGWPTREAVTWPRALFLVGTATWKHVSLDAFLGPLALPECWPVLHLVWDTSGWAVLAVNMTKILVAKLLCLVGVFILMLLGSILPVKIIEADYEKAHRSKKILSLCNSFGGGVFLATCFNALLPAVREKLQEVLKLGNITTDYPLAETIMLLGFFMTVFVEQVILTFRKEKPSFIDLETFNAGSDVGSDSEYESPFIGNSRGHNFYPEHGHHSHGHGLNVQELSRSSPLRLFSLVFALSAHSIFEGLALGLQEEGDKVMSLFVGVAIHETLVAVALGINMAKSSLSMKDAAKLAVTVSLMIPLGIGIGVGIERTKGVASSVASVLLQGFAGGTFLFVTFFEILVKELEDKNDRLLKVLFLVLGYAVLAGLVFFKW